MGFAKSLTLSRLPTLQPSLIPASCGAKKYRYEQRQNSK
jgi:hypothetical protein